MKRLIAAMCVLVFMCSSCNVHRGSKIFKDYSKEKDKFRADKKYKPPKNCKSWK